MKLQNNPFVSASLMLFELQWSSSRHRGANVDSLSTTSPKWMEIHRTWVAVGVLHPEQFCEPPGICRGPTLTCRATIRLSPSQTATLACSLRAPHPSAEPFTLSSPLPRPEFLDVSRNKLVRNVGIVNNTATHVCKVRCATSLDG